jgi:hypothetical protein
MDRKQPPSWAITGEDKNAKSLKNKWFMIFVDWWGYGCLRSVTAEVTGSSPVQVAIFQAPGIIPGGLVFESTSYEFLTTIHPIMHSRRLLPFLFASHSSAGTL